MTRNDVDRYAENCQNKYFEAQQAGFFNEEVFRSLKSGVLDSGYKPRKFKLKDGQDLSQDEHPRKTSLEKLGTLPYVFTRKVQPQLEMHQESLMEPALFLSLQENLRKNHGLKVLGKIRGVVSVGVNPKL